MFHRTAALTAAILALSAVGGASVALAGGETTTVTVPGPAPPPVTVTTPAPPPVTVTTPAPPPPPVTKPAPRPKRHHRSQQSSSGGSNSGGSNSGSSNGRSGVSAPDTRDTTPVALKAVNTSETSTVPKGGIQAGGGGTAIAHDASSMAGVLGAAVGLLLVVTGMGLALRRRVLAA